jgi:hypothetical protein
MIPELVIGRVKPYNINTITWLVERRQASFIILEVPLSSPLFLQVAAPSSDMQEYRVTRGISSEETGCSGINGIFAQHPTYFNVILVEPESSWNIREMPGVCL